MLSGREVDKREEDLRVQVRGLNSDQKKAFYELCTPRLKDPDTYSTLNFLFLAGLHHFYLGKWLRGGINLAVFLTGIYFIFTGQWLAGLAIVLGITAAELYALFRSEIIVRDHNNDVMEKCLKITSPETSSSYTTHKKVRL